jgi:hypothetical protein
VFKKLDGGGAGGYNYHIKYCEPTTGEEP